MPTAAKYGYPPSRREEISEVIHGQIVSDPYRWLESSDSEEAASWKQQQNQVSDSYLKGIENREHIKKRMRELWNYEKFGLPVKRGDRIFYTHNDGLQNHSVLYWQDGIEDEPKALLDPNTFSDDGTVALIDFEPSDDGKLLAYGLSESGSDWQKWRIRDIESGEDLDDLVEWVKFSIASWSQDGSGFYYSRYDEPVDADEYKGANYFHKLYYHRIGQQQSDDRLIYERQDEKEWGFFGEVSQDGRYLIITIIRGTQREKGVFYQDLHEPEGKIIELLEDFGASYEFIGNRGEQFYFLTDLEAPLSQVIAIDIREPDRDRWRTVISENEDSLQFVSMSGDYFIAAYLHDASSRLAVLDENGNRASDITLPGIGTVVGVSGRFGDSQAFYSYTSFTRPVTIYGWDAKTKTSRLFRESEIDFDADSYQTQQLSYESNDGTVVPLFVSRHTDVKPGKETPLYLYGYGGFNIAQTPVFSAANIIWMEMGGIFALACIRGGSEYGKAWHEGGMKLKRQNVFDDFIAAAEFLITEEYTSTPKLAIGGRSNGGLLVGACITQRPELYGGCLLYVGVLDMLRFTHFTIGWAWTSDYGSPDVPEEFRALRAYSPYHNIEQGKAYPPTLILTGDHDDRVFPAHSFKFAAALQHAQDGDGPVLIRIDTRAGHGLGKPTAKLIEESADGWAFLSEALGMDQ